MKTKRELYSLLLAVVGLWNLGEAQTKTDFALFAQHQDSLFIQSYEKRDVGRYQQLLDEYLGVYNKLDSVQRKNFTWSLTNVYYNFACTYSLLGNKDQAIAQLSKAVKAGYADYSHLQKDTDFDNIRSDKEFKALVDPLRAVGDYLFILKGARSYDNGQRRELPAFTYQSPSDSNLAALRKSFKLDSIAGGGNEVSRLLNLLHWMHNVVRHDGNHGNPDGRNAPNMIAVCQREGRGLNCRGLSIALNECYLALGFKSRFVGCIPKDSLKIDNDTHVINVVYLESLKKWVWVDPTNDAYVMNEKGELLGVEEVRERLINDRPLILNPDANWNRRSSVTTENYLYRYMAKNLYKLICPVESRFDLETRARGKVVTYIELLPLEHYEQTPLRRESTDTESGTTLVWYRTNNAKDFWATPK